MDEIRDHFYRVVNMPFQTPCTVAKTFGGHWSSKCGGMDGNKFVCLDQFYAVVINKSCLIYSFGVAGDWSFEESMAQMGCTVRAFDPTISGDEKPSSSLVTFHFDLKLLGLGALHRKHNVGKASKSINNLYVNSTNPL